MSRRHAMAALAVGGIGGAAVPWTDCRGVAVADAAITLLPCPARPNCVSTEHAEPARRLAAPAGITMARLREAVLGEPRSTIVTQGERWLIARFRSRVFGFVDEAHFILREDGRLSARSGACSGYSDFGVNRRRMVRIFEALGKGA